MRVLHLVSEKTWRGGEQQVAYLIMELAQHGITSFVACRRGSAFEAHCRDGQIPYIPLTFSKLALLGDAVKLKAYVNHHQIQLIHLHSSMAHTLGVLAHMLGARPSLILSRRVAFAIGKNLFSAFKYNYKAIKRILCVSDSVSRQMAANIQDSRKCITVYDGINLPGALAGLLPNPSFLRDTYHLPNDLKLIGNVSALDKHKDYFTFLDTAKILKSRGVKAKYFAIGSGRLEPEIKAYAVQLGLQHDVIFTGFIQNAKEALAEFDVFLFTTIKEGIGSTILDAFIRKVPVVATSTGGIPEIVMHEQTGLLAPVKDASALAARVERVLTDTTLRNNLTERAYQLALTFTIERTALQTAAVYKEVLAVD